jgi:hypothetical protein
MAESTRKQGKFNSSSACSKGPSANKSINMKPGNERGKQTMAHSVYEQTSEQIGDTIHKASRAASSAAEAIEDGVGAARRAVKQGRYAAAELYGDARRRVQRNPIEAVVATFAAGIATGAAISWMVKRKQSRECEDACEGVE